ncbi:hypothetical protein RA210_U240015 [Rubrivivax sp. A210]|nr:hypothetical protein RA210_U240015 [Rubrivivax sp. A210]
MNGAPARSLPAVTPSCRIGMSVDAAPGRAAQRPPGGMKKVFQALDLRRPPAALMRIGSGDALPLSVLMQEQANPCFAALWQAGGCSPSVLRLVLGPVVAAAQDLPLRRPFNGREQHGHSSQWPRSIHAGPLGHGGGRCRGTGGGHRRRSGRHR